MRLVRLVQGGEAYILGVNSGPHDPSAALLRGGKLVAMIEQERLSRKKHATIESPGPAIAACLAEAGIDLGDVAEIAVGWDVPRLRTLEGSGEFDESGFRARLLEGVPGAGGAEPPLRFVDHHIAHAASAFYTSGLKEAAILIVDGTGESTASMVARGGPDGIELLRTWDRPLSIGHLYGCAADWAGLGYWGAGKLMGLASYGRPCQPAPLTVVEDGYTIAAAPQQAYPIMPFLTELRDRLHSSFNARNYPFAKGEPDDVMAYADFAASIQRALEEVLLELAALARRESGHSSLAFAGGVALNCTANGALVRSGLFEEVWIPPVPHDAGVSLGAALFAARAATPEWEAPARLGHAFLAPDRRSSPKLDDKRLAGCEIWRAADPELAETVARYLSEEKLVGWWQGRAEVGQRALGARSILCDPRGRHMLVHANRVKGREPWRPLAPVVLAEHADELFDGPLPAISKFMLAAWPVRPEAQARIPAAVHVDGTARPQIVGPERSRYREVIEAFHARTGVPAIVNTSFNLAGEPVVLSAEDAIQTFASSELDVLVLDDAIVVKPEKGGGERDADGGEPDSSGGGWPFRAKDG